MCDHHHLRAPSPAGEVNHVVNMSENIGSLFLQEEYSDVVLLVEQMRFPAHKVILAARSEYFRALLFGGMKESNEPEVELKETSAVAMRHLLKYIYTGKMLLSDLKEDILLEVMGLAHQYVFKDLEMAISDYLKSNLNITNVSLIYDIAFTYELKSLYAKCCEFIDRHASEIMNSEAFANISPKAVEALVTRDSFYAEEIDIFKAVRSWKEANPELDYSGIMAAVRLPLMSMEQLLNDVRGSQLVCADAILDAIKVKNESAYVTLKHRGLLFPEENVALASVGAQVVCGEMRGALLDGDSKSYDLDRGFSRHPIDGEDDQVQGLVVCLRHPHIINSMRLLLWDRDQRSYSYYIQVSMNNKDYVTVVDHRKYLCRSWQHLRFPPTVARYIRIAGTHNTVNRVFHAVAFECIHTKKPVHLSSGKIIPSCNVATIEAKALVIEGVSRSRNALIDGDVKDYDWDSGYTCHQLGSGAIVIQLAQPYIIDSMRLLLWDCDTRTYSYYIEVSTDQTNWMLVADKTREACRSWQTLIFDPQPVTFIRIVGTHNTANEVFHCVHFECPASSAALEEAKRVRHAPVVPFTPYYAADRHDEAVDASSDPEDEAGARGYLALAPAAVVAAAQDFPEAAAGPAPVNYLLLNRAQPAPAPVPYGIMAPAGVNRGDGFGFEVAEYNHAADEHADDADIGGLQNLEQQHQPPHAD